MSSVRKLPVTEAMDKHHCLACDIIVQGLDRYILHKRQDCPALQLVRSTNNGVSTPGGAIPHRETPTEERIFSLAGNTATDCLQDADSLEKESTKNSVGTPCGTITPRETPTEERPCSLATDCMQDIGSQEMGRKEMAAVEVHVAGTGCLRTSSQATSGLPENLDFITSDESATMEVPSSSCAVGEPPSSLMEWESSTTVQKSKGTNEASLDTIVETMPQADKNERVKTKKQHWCSVCKRTFLSAAGLNRHLRSRKHKSISSQAPSVSSLKPSYTESPGSEGNSSSESSGVNESKSFEANSSASSAKALTTRNTHDVNKYAFRRKRRVQRKRNCLNSTGMADPIEHEDAYHNPSKSEHGNKDESMESTDKEVEEEEIQKQGNTEEDCSTHAKGGGSKVKNNSRRKGRPRQHQKSDSEEKDNSKQHSCSECSFKSTYKASLRRHLEASHSLHLCSPCNETFVTSEEYTTHQMEVHGTSSKRCRAELECSDCAVQFSTEEDLDIHRREARHMLYIGSTCVFCRKTVSNVTCLRAHIQAVHLGEKPHKCQYCPYSTAWATDLRMHIKRHLGIKAFKCPECDYTAVRMEAVKKHLQTHREGEPRTLCEICGKSFAGNLQRHMKLHEGLKPFVCLHEGCTYASTYKQGLDVHVRSVHLADKNILCEECGFATTTDKLMKWHKRRKHSGEKPHKCDQCNYATTWRPHLIRHKRTHTGEKPYKCPHCSYSANNVENLRKHILKTKKHQGLQQYICKWCPYTTNSQHDFSHHLRCEHPGEDLGITPTFVLGINRGVVKMRSIRSQDKLGQLAAEVHDDTDSMEGVGALSSIVLPQDRLQNDDERK